MKAIVKIPLKFGLFGAIVLLAVFFISHLAGKNPFTTPIYLDIVILTIFLFFGIKEYKDYHNQGFLEFAEGMTVGFICYGLIALGVGAIIGLSAVINEDILRLSIENALTHIQSGTTDFQEQFGQELTEQTIREIEQETTPVKLMLDILVKKAAIGLMLTIMMSVIMRNKRKNAA